MRYKDCFDQERRNFLRVVQRSGIAMGAIQASSLLAGVMMARVAEAQTGSANKSLTVFMPGGCTPAKYYPASGTTLPTQSAPLQSHFSAGRIALLKNATMMNGGHGVMFCRFNEASPWGGKQSFDVNIGKVLSANSNAPVKWLNLGTTPISEMSRDSAGIPTITSPQAALDILFAGGGGGGGTVAPRKSMVDFHYAAVNDLKNKLGQHEKQKLDSHFNAISEIEASITNTNPGGGCSAPPNASAIGFDATSKLMTDIAVLALECNLSSSVSLAFGSDDHNHVLDGPNIINTDGTRARPSHDSHHNQGNPNYAGYYDQDVRYYMSLTAQLLDKLQAKNLLTSTIVTQVSDMGNVDAHSGQNTPMLVAGAGVRGGVVDVGGLSQVALFQTVGLALKANQGPNGGLFRSWGGTTMAGLF